jgi:hypothetical protein
MPASKVITETGWDPRSRRTSRLRWLTVIMNLMSPNSFSAGQDLSTGEPRWRLVVQDNTGTRWAESAWRRDWTDVEHLRADWESRLSGASPADLRFSVFRWNGE